MVQQDALSKDQTVRFQLAMGGKYTEDQLEKVFQWVMGPKQTILPVNRFEVVKND